MWKDVETDFDAMAAGCQGFSQHPALSLKQKFTLHCEMKKQTGDPSTAPNVRLAKLINTDIHSEISAGELAADCWPAVKEL